jgi:hypothetical protein
VHIILHAPHYYLETIPYSFYIYLHSASDYEHLRSRDAIDELDTLWNRAFYWQWQKNETLVERASTFSPDHVAWLLAIIFLVAFIGAPVYLWGQRARFETPEYALVVFMYWNIVFVSAAGILLDIGENNRTRFAIDPLILLLSVFFVRKVFLSLR